MVVLPLAAALIRSWANLENAFLKISKRVYSGQETVYFGTKPLLARSSGSQADGWCRNSFWRSPGRRKALHPSTPWKATMTKGDHMAAQHHRGTPAGVRPPRGRQ